MKQHFDFLVIGAGSGGIATARRAAHYGAKVGVVERGPLGGTCVNVGCVPKKVMYNAATIADMLKHDAEGYGFDVTVNGFDFASLSEKRTAYVHRLNGIYERNLGRSEVTHIQGDAKFVDKMVIGVGDDKYSADHILIATGGRPRKADIPGGDLGMDSDGFFNELTELPKKIAIIGTGYIGVEISGVLNSLGSEVDLYSSKDIALNNFDEILANGVTEALIDAGVNFKPNSRPTEVLQDDEGLYTVKVGEESFSGYTHLLWAIGRIPNVETLNLDIAGVQLDSRGKIEVDEYQNTSAENIYAVGDVISRIDLTPVAIAAGRKLAARLFDNQTDIKQDYTNVPSVVFSHPPCGSVGLTTTQAEEKYGKDNVRTYSCRFTNMYHAMTEHKTSTRMKMVCTGENDTVVGLHLFGMGTDEMLQGFAVCLKMGATRQQFNDTIPIHPTGAEEVVLLKPAL